MKFRSTLLAALIAMQAPTAFGLGFNAADRAIRRMPLSSTKFSLHPFQANATQKPTGFSLFENGRLSFNDSIIRALRSQMTNPMLDVRATDVRSFGLTTATKTREIRFYVAGTPICGFQVKAHELADRTALVLGDLPAIDLNEPLPSGEWPDFDLSLDQVKDAAGTSQVRVMQSSKCFYAANGSLLPVWSMKVQVGGLPYNVLADAYELVAMEAGYFDIDGSGTAYDYNTLEGEAKSTKITDLVGDGTLTSTYLKTYVPSAYGERAKSKDHKFDYPETDKRFQEVQAYVHTQRHFDYFKSLGFEWYGPSPIEIKLHVKPGGASNNALFTPGSDIDGSLPTIQVDDGDGKVLRNLVTDGDVVSHEFGHHVVYKTLTSTSGQSLILHEGLADAFVFLRTKNACLGESICPKGSGACILDGQCLRSGEIGLKYDDEDWNNWSRQGHLRGQLISGFVWELGKAMSQANVAALVFKAISYFREDSGIRDFVLALFTADKELYGSANYDLIRTTAEAHNLGDFMEDVTKDNIPQLEGTAGALPSGVKDGEGKKKEKGDENPFRCGTIAGMHGDASTIILLLLISLPLLVAARPAPVRVLSKVKRRRS